jgi:Asp-tRNA(Asn)/Glu-tRNA(Gln) amidotransferase B subunit
MPTAAGLSDQPALPPDRGRRADRDPDDEKDESSAKTIGIERIHIEQDAGKLMHDQHPSFSYVDLNRSASR